MDGFIEPLRVWLKSTDVSYFMTHSPVAWPACAVLHFLGLTLVIGTIGLWDLRLLGVGKGLSPAAMHRLVRWGVLGFAVNLMTGTLFFIGQPDRYINNPAFELKVLFLIVLGVNILIFYSTVYRKVATLGPGGITPLGAKIAGAISLVFWVGVIVAGRMVAFFVF
jgi:hypothetical protein